MYQKTEAVILSRKNFQEADRLLTIYTKDFGKISCIAKGVRKPTSRKSGHLENGSWCEVFIAKGKNLDILTEVELKKAFGLDNLKSEKTNEIYHFLELVDSLTPHNQKNIEVFSLLVNFLKKIELSQNFSLVSTVFKLRLLSILGFFSADNLKLSNAKTLLGRLQNEDLNKLQDEIIISENDYLKLSTFLDSIIEGVSERKLKTNRFIHAQL